jgi:cation transport ATPase
MRYFTILREKGEQHDSVELTAELLRMHIDAELKRLRQKLARAKNEQAEIEMAMEHLRRERPRLASLRQVAQFVPTLVAGLLAGLWMISAATGTTGFERWLSIAVASVLFAIVGWINVRHYRRWSKKQRWVEESRLLQIEAHERRLAAIADEVATCTDRVAELRACVEELNVDREDRLEETKVSDTMVSFA